MNLITDLLIGPEFAGLRDGLFLIALAALALIIGLIYYERERAEWQ